MIHQKSFVMAFMYMIIFHAGKLHVCKVYRKPKVFKLSSYPEAEPSGNSLIKMVYLLIEDSEMTISLKDTKVYFSL